MLNLKLNVKNVQISKKFYARMMHSIATEESSLKYQFHLENNKKSNILENSLIF